ncbi:MAG TPA: hybrid sensor histidine kinase/response regulator [Longimicrobiales bacterium]
MSTQPATVESVVVIDDDYAMRLTCKQILVKMGFAVEVFDNGADGLDGVARLKPALVVVDLKMPGISGMEVVARVHEMDAEAIIVVITGYATIGTAVEAMKCGAYDFLPKPFSPDELRVIVNRGLERRQLQRETRQLRADQEQLRRRFVTFVSHQLQSPLSAVHQYLDVLKHIGDDPAGEAKRCEWLERCLARTAELQELIRDWLALSHIESGLLVRATEAVDVRDVVPAVLATYEQMAASQGVSLHADLAVDSCPVLADRGVLNLLIDNLVVNAIKYNRVGGSVDVSVSLHGNEIVIAVADTGIGIGEKHLEFLFNEFFRAHTESTRNITGTGLGLALCKRIAAELGGTIEVHSVEGTGSTFRILLPLVSPAVPEEVPAGAA